MFNIIQINLYNVLLSAVFYVVVIVSALLLFKWLWIDKVDFSFPRGKYKILKDNTDAIKVRNLGELFTFMWEVLYRLDYDYWMENIGLEGGQG